ncbi:polysaccharide deacetylase WbmS family protein [Tissierella creatinophila]|uniref:Polysaccharide deacetylase n=1 Tax=Tissierella creatinophila DSM 6911 TaxID=1123403 RepID=A0A1U7M8U7_TISCR|nr:hypothetical protein [Tissierella creatinophila]OLS03670.1 hypothetical protein TICRE_03660 [Tissierella creatinophila DSM 6911]
MSRINNHLWKSEPIICLTFDVDWASEDALKYSYNIIEKYGFKTTFFLTHESKFILELIEKGDIDGGIHPNFLINSSHGNSYDEVIDYCTTLLPQAEAYRCHRYFDVNDITETFAEKGYKYDSNVCTFLQIVEPFVHRSGLVRFPIFFEDGAYLFHRQNLNFKEVGKQLFNNPGLMILNIHPMHMALNSPDFYYMRKVKDSLTREEWNNLNYKLLEKIRYKGYGIRDFIIEIFEFIKEENIKTYTLNEIYKIIR